MFRIIYDVRGRAHNYEYLIDKKENIGVVSIVFNF